MLIALDAANAFDNADHNILKSAINHFCDVHKYMHSILDSRMGQVVEKRKLGRIFKVPAKGIPQGGHSSPALFSSLLLEVNEITKYDSQSKIILFADDLLILVARTRTNEAIQVAQQFVKSVVK